MRYLVLALLSMAALSACSKKANNTTDANGNCTAGYIADHNDVKNKLDLVDSDCNFSPFSEFCRQDKVAARASCDNFQAQHKSGRTCSAVPFGLNRKVEFNTADVHAACNSFRARYP